MYTLKKKTEAQKVLSFPRSFFKGEPEEIEIWVFVESRIGLWVDQKYRTAEFIGDPNKVWSLKIYNGKISFLLYESHMQQLDDQGQSWKKIIRFKEGEILQ